MYISGNVGSGSPQEMADWMEYMTSNTVSTLANERRKNGRDKPWDVHYFGIGNETWGCGGNMTPEFYANLFRQYATYVKAPRGKRPVIVASGGNDEHTHWADVLTKNVHRDMDAISHHYYTMPTGVWRKKGNSIGFPESEWISTLKHTMQHRPVHHQQREDPRRARSAEKRRRSTSMSGAPGTTRSRAASRASSGSRTRCAMRWSRDSTSTSSIATPSA